MWLTPWASLSALEGVRGAVRTRPVLSAGPPPFRRLALAHLDPIDVLPGPVELALLHLVLLELVELVLLHLVPLDVCLEAAGLAGQAVLTFALRSYKLLQRMSVTTFA